MKVYGWLILLLLGISNMAAALDAGDFDEVEGYTIITTSTVNGEFEGADFDKPVGFDNGMIFVFSEYSYSYSYRPEVVVFARSYGGVVLYKLLIDDDFYDARRLR